jgi:YggT family protein
LNGAIATLFTIFLYFLIAAIIIRSLMSWFPIGRDNQFSRAIYQVTEPLLEPVRRLVPRTGIIDFSAMIVIVLLYVMLQVVSQIGD